MSIRLAPVSPWVLGGLAGLTVACSGAAPSGPAADAPQAPIPFLLQYAGEYGGAGHVQGLVLHVDGSFDATIDGQAGHGVYAGPRTPGDATLTLRADDGRQLTASFQITAPPAGAPSQVLAAVRLDGGAAESLASLWVAGGEGMCSATHGTWRDDDPDPASGLLCVCAQSDVYLPSRGGCVAPRAAGDPPRLSLSDAAQRRAGDFDGSGRVEWLDLATDGTFRAKIDGQTELGTWWDASASVLGSSAGGIAIACTSAAHALGATLGEDGTLTVRLSATERETLAHP